ncbi:MAG: flagellar hook-basal body complex protein FliE [Myxococcota bacterium]
MRPIAGLTDGAPPLVEPARKPLVNGPEFTSALEKAVDNVERAQQSADAQATKLATGGGNLHEVALALEKADITMRVAVKVRNKVVEAYQDVMRMNV